MPMDLECRIRELLALCGSGKTPRHRQDKLFYYHSSLWYAAFVAAQTVASSFAQACEALIR
ncbi:hypothetical protein, partial [Desulfobotulus alkaliphilus]